MLNLYIYILILVTAWSGVVHGDEDCESASKTYIERELLKNGDVLRTMTQIYSVLMEKAQKSGLTDVKITNRITFDHVGNLYDPDTGTTLINALKISVTTDLLSKGGNKRLLVYETDLYYGSFSTQGEKVANELGEWIGEKCTFTLRNWADPANFKQTVLLGDVLAIQLTDGSTVDYLKDASTIAPRMPSFKDIKLPLIDIQ